jgi:hypothetical protein
VWNSRSVISGVVGLRSRDGIRRRNRVTVPRIGENVTVPRIGEKWTSFRRWSTCSWSPWTKGDVHHDRDAELAEHVANPLPRPTRGGKTLDAGHPERPIVCVQAALLAFEAAMTMPEIAAPFFAIGWL